MPEFVRVYDPVSKTQYSLPENGSVDGLEVIDGADTVDHNGDPLPPSTGKSKSGAAAAQKES